MSPPGAASWWSVGRPKNSKQKKVSIPVNDRVLCLLLGQHLDDLFDVPLWAAGLGEHQLDGEGEARGVEAHEGEIVDEHRDQGVGAQQLCTQWKTHEYKQMHNGTRRQNKKHSGMQQNIQENINERNVSSAYGTVPYLR